MQAPINTRKGIPFFHQKTKHEFQQDAYERYDEMVVRQSALHLTDDIWGGYPFQPIFDFAEKHYPKRQEFNILEVGCGVGRWISSLAKHYPNATCWGMDYSYQMLKRANEFWVEGQEITIDLTRRGLDKQTLNGEQLINLKFGLAKAEHLPFEDNTQQLIVNSFLLDRLENPLMGLKEIYRVLKPSGKLIIVSPLNFKKAEHWRIYYPSIRLSNILREIGFDILEWKEDLIVHEPLDAHGNLLSWKCLGFVLSKGED